jgi:DNA polymerase elongation subunit (family B)
MYSVDKYEIPIIDRIASEWEKENRFELETDHISEVWVKDVNNLLMVKTDGVVKKVGGYLNHGVSVKGAWAINNTMIIVKKALVEFFVNGTPVEDTINACDDIFQFQIIAKAGAKYKEAYHLVDGGKQPVQKVNRVYATKNTLYGKIYKVKAENDSEAKIDSLPDHCIIDNENELTISDVDKTFYIEMAKKRVNDFLGIPQEKPKKERTKKMASTKTEARNVYQKLIEARELFLASDINQSGKNMNLEFKYFELKDIVPTITKIFKDLGLVAVARFTDTVATLSVVNTDNTEEVIEFPVPFNQIQPIVSNSGKQVTNDMQALGSSITYMRRYLYLIAMDICVNDEVDGNIGANAAPAPEKKAPATPVQRQETKSAVTAPSEGATDLQIKGLKGVLKKLKEAQPDKEEFITEIVLETNTFTEVSKARCEELIQTVTKMLEG